MEQEIRACLDQKQYRDAFDRLLPEFQNKVFRLAYAMLGEADYVAVAAPLTRHTEGMLGAAEFRAMKVPEVLLSGNHGEIARWRAEQARLRTKERRPDLM